MLNKIYENIKKILKENKGTILFFIVTTLVFFVEFPYYIDAPGSIIDVEDRITVENSYISKGNFYMASVSEIKGILPMLIWASFNKDMDIVKKEKKIYNNETYEEADLRSKLMLKNSLDNAVLVAYQKAEKEVTLLNEKLYVIVVYEEADTDLQVGDQLLKINGEEINTTSDLKKVLDTKAFGEKLELLVKNNEKEIKRTAIIQNIEGEKYLGIGVLLDFNIETNPDITFSFKASESGPSGGLMLSLAIYNSLVEDDITRGKKIVGTGTIDADGKVGAIGGVKYKIAAAVREKAEIFIVPQDNYEEAKKVIKENNYDIKLIVTASFEETLEKLKQI